MATASPPPFSFKRQREPPGDGQPLSRSRSLDGACSQVQGHNGHQPFPCAARWRPQGRRAGAPATRIPVTPQPAIFRLKQRAARRTDETLSCRSNAIPDHFQLKETWVWWPPPSPRSNVEMSRCMERCTSTRACLNLDACCQFKQHKCLNTKSPSPSRIGAPKGHYGPAHPPMVDHLTAPARVRPTVYSACESRCQQSSRASAPSPSITVAETAAVVHIHQERERLTFFIRTEWVSVQEATKNTAEHGQHTKQAGVP